MGRFGQTNHLLEFVSCLAEELETTEDSPKKESLLYALYRNTESLPGRRNEAYRCLDKVVEQNPESEDLIWEQWRVSGKRGRTDRLAAIDRLLPILKKNVEKAHCHLLRAQILYDQQQNNEAALKDIDAAYKLLPESLETLFTKAEFEADDKSRSSLLNSLESIASHVNDPVFKSALLVEIAALTLDEIGSFEAVSKLLAELLAQRDNDWSTLQAARHLSAKIEDWGLYDKALSLMANATLEPSGLEDASKPSGHYFKGFEPTESAAAAFFWFQSLVREQRLENAEAALESMYRAVELLPKSEFLRRELIRLLEKCGRIGDALELVPHVLDDCEASVLAMTGGTIELAASFARTARDSQGTLLAELLAQGACRELGVPTEQASSDARVAWLEANPHHSNLGTVAQSLLDSGAAYPLCDIIAQESASGDEPVLSIVRNNEDESWAQALMAMLGDMYSRAEYFEKWADSTADQSLKATLTLMAAHAVEQASGPRNTIENLVSHAESLSRESIEPEMAFEPVAENWRKEADALKDKVTAAEDTDTVREALYKRVMILEHALNDIKAAEKTLNDLIAISGKDATAIWFGIKVACRAGRWPLVLTLMNQFIPLVREDAGQFDVFLAELLLLEKNDPVLALRYIENATANDNDEMVALAKFYRFFALSLLNDSDSVAHAFGHLSNDMAQDAADTHVEFFPSETLPIGGDRSSELVAVARQLEGKSSEIPLELLTQIRQGMKFQESGPPELDEVVNGFYRLGDLSTNDETGNGLIAAAKLLDDTPFKTNECDITVEDASLDTLWLKADNSELFDDAFAAASLYRARAGGEEEPVEDEWIDWILLHAEAEEEKGNIESAYDTVCEYLETAQTHPGLLEAKARLAKKLGYWEETADTHGRLARFYDSQEEKAFHLSQAAFILFDKLDNPRGAKRICEEAVRRAPSYAKANDMLIYILKACGDRRFDGFTDEQVESDKDVDELIDVRQLQQKISEAEESHDIHLLSHLSDTLSVAREQITVPFDWCLIPNRVLTKESVRRLCEHPLESCAAAEAARVAGGISLYAVDRVSTVPETIENVDLLDDLSIESWCNGWGSLLEIERFSIHRSKIPNNGIAAYVPEENVLLIPTNLSCPLSVVERFRLGRYLYRLRQGLGAFTEGDIEGPIKWIRSLAVALCGGEFDLTDSVDIDIVGRTIEALSPSLSIKLEIPLSRVLYESDHLMVSWVDAASYSADRFGLLVAGQLSEVIGALLTESNEDGESVNSGNLTMERVNDTPRVREIVSFATSEEYFTAISRKEKKT